MTRFKKFLAVLLALILALGLGLPAKAENWWDGIEVVLRSQGQNPDKHGEVLVRSGRSFTVEAELRGAENLPEGWTATYHWDVEVVSGEKKHYVCFVTTEPSLHISPGNEMYPATFSTGNLEEVWSYFNCAVTIKLASGEERIMERKWIVVVILRSFWEKLPDYFVFLGSFLKSIPYMLVSLVLNLPELLAVSLLFIPAGITTILLLPLALIPMILLAPLALIMDLF
ncbi:MAG: hypothetical protein FWH26_02495 [Oscillospiraceae bacterium]|nr:hypothetical protein [Oscillospiraceae bacterium]